MAGYEDIDNWNSQQQSLLQQQEAKQNEIINQQTQLNIDALNREKEKLDRETNKTTQGLYTNYQKMANNYGVQAEQQAKMGLNNSGYAETSKINLYNTYQKNVTEAITNANNLKADFDFKISEARKQGSLSMAQNALELYKQRMQIATQELEMRTSRDQWQQQFDYQKERDKIADEQWRQTFDLQKKNLLASSSRSSSRKSSGKSSSSNSGNTVDTSSNNNSSVTEQEVLKNMKQMQGVNKDGSPYFKVKDGLTGKVYNSPSDLLASYGY